MRLAGENPDTRKAGDSDLELERNFVRRLQDAFERADSSVRFCRRKSYIHVHGPSQALSSTRCNSHLIVIEKNGTVGLAAPLAAILDADKRPDLPIALHPLGHSSGPNYGRFDHGITTERIMREHSGIDGFVSHVVAKAIAAGLW